MKKSRLYICIYLIALFVCIGFVVILGAGKDTESIAAKKGVLDLSTHSLALNW